MKKCFLCNVSDEEILDFDNDTFKKCNLKLLFRKKKAFKYHDVQLTKESVESLGYHTTCYKKVTTLSQKYNEQYLTFVSNEVHELSGDFHEEISKSSPDDTVNSTTSTAEDHHRCLEFSGHSGAINNETEDRNVNKINSFSMDLNEVPSLTLAMPNSIDERPDSISETFHSIARSVWSTADNLFESTQIQDSSTETLPPRSSTSGKNTVCLFCGNKQKTGGKYRYQLIFPESEQIVQIKTIAESLNDSEVTAKLANQTISYHKICFTAYRQTDKRHIEEYKQSYWHDNRELHKFAYESLVDFINREIIENDKVMYFAQLFSRYQALICEFGEGKIDSKQITNYRPEYLEKKILKSFGDCLTIETSTGPRCKKIVYKTDIDLSVMANNAKVFETKDHTKFEDVAFYLRNCIKTMSCKSLPSHLTAENIIDGECEIPEKLFEFVHNLIGGPHASNDNSNQIAVKVTSLCSDIIYAVTKGRCKPAKNLTLGLAIKSLTNSRQVITMLNRYGHTIGYNLAEELETEMTYTAVEDNKIIPAGIDIVNGRSTHVAFDNFDRFVDTTSGKDTMHDTVGIIYQFPHTENEDPDEIEATISSALPLDDNRNGYRPSSRKRRRFNEISRGVRQYYSKPTASMQMLTVDSFNSVIDLCKGATEIAIDKDLLWIMSLSRIDSVPLWLGFNCMILTDHSEIQKVDYLPPINCSPTSYAIVNETLVMAQEIAEKCGEETIIVTYDLAIAKMAMQIQENEKPKFNNIFINLGSFHMQIAFFKAIGKFIDSSGLVEVLVQAEVLAGGSMNSFLDSKHFNRCKRLHPLTAAALQTLHFEQYLSTIQVSPEMLDELLKIVIDTKSNQTVSDVNERIELPDLLSNNVNGYKEFCKHTLMGEHGKTAQYYYQYCEFINLFLRFSRSIRTSNFELYLDSIFNMTDLFFALNQPNYARWSLMYLSNLIRLHQENSPLVTEFRRGAFGIRRTKANFARSPVDLTLEQTINADASNQLANNLTADSISARQRWALSHSMRTKILTAVKENLGLSQKDDTSHSLQKSRIKKDKTSLHSITETIKNTVNPFDDSIDTNVLFNISNGKAASSDVTDFLLTVKSVGNQQKLTFISECCSVNGRFEKPISRNKFFNFASQCISKVQVNKDKQAVVRMERDIFGRLLAISLEKKINVEHCLTFPLAPMPPALFSYSGEMLKTDKSTLAKTLKSQVQMVQPTQIDVEIVDGFYFLHLIGSSLPQTFDKVAESILIKLCSSIAAEIHIIFDRYLTPSIKDSERQNRQGFDIPYRITGPLQPRPTDFLGSLKNYRFKDAVVQFLADYWENDHLASIMQTKKIFITVGSQCYSFQIKENHVVKTEEIDYECQHEEADTRIMFHASKVQPASKILVKASDTDVLIILLANTHKVCESEIWLTGSATKNKRNKDLNCINCTELASKLGSSLCLSLPAFHAFTGCDYTAAFYNKGKVRPFKIFSKNETYKRTFASLTYDADIFIDEKIDIVQEFTALIYGIKQCRSVNAARFRIFQTNYSAKTVNEQFLKKLKSFNSNMIPPCWKSLKQKILRTIYVNSMWLNATDRCCVKLLPESCGWYMDGYLKPIGFLGDPTPLKVDDILQVTTDSDNTEDNPSEFIITTSDESDSE